MDGFYVAKIQKLSDKRKGDQEKKETENELGQSDENKVSTNKDGNSKLKKEKAERRNVKVKKRHKTLIPVDWPKRAKCLFLPKN